MQDLLQEFSNLQLQAQFSDFPVGGGGNRCQTKTNNMVKRQTKIESVQVLLKAVVSVRWSYLEVRADLTVLNKLQGGQLFFFNLRHKDTSCFPQIHISLTKCSRTVIFSCIY